MFGDFTALMAGGLRILNDQLSCCLKEHPEPKINWHGKKGHDGVLRQFKVVAQSKK